MAPDRADDADGPPIRVAIACQGGGSHTAFTAGVLGRLLQPDVVARHQIVGLSGTSGGAICALLAWTALLAGDPARADRLLRQFWAANSATSPAEKLVNAWVLWAAQLADYVVTPAVSPYDTPTATMAMAHLRSMLTDSVDFDALGSSGDDRPMLLLGAVDVLSGEFKAFDSRRDEITADAVLASAAIPTLFRSVRTDGGVYWDGLFSQNPPVRDLLDAGPDEIWVIQINPKELASEPSSVVAIADRRNELSGNLSLHQELHFIEKVDAMLDDGVLVGSKYRPITVRVIEMARSKLSGRLGPVSKLNRAPEFLTALMADGRARAEEFVTALAFENAWRSGDFAAVTGFFADDAVVAAQAPFAPQPERRGPDAVRTFVEQRLGAKVRVDLTRKQIAGDTVAWGVRTPKTKAGRRIRGRATVRFEDGKVTSLRLGPADSLPS